MFFLKIKAKIIYYITYFKTFLKSFKKAKNCKCLIFTLLPDENKSVKIKDWQERENHTNSCNINKNINTKEIKKIQKRVICEDVLYKEDIELYNKNEYWATTNEILKLGYGDCEDQAFVIMKYLVEAGYNENQVFVVIVKDKKANNYHAIACIRENSNINDFYIIDNNNYFVGIVNLKDINKYCDIEFQYAYNFTNQYNIKVVNF